MRFTWCEFKKVDMYVALHCCMVFTNLAASARIPLDPFNPGRRLPAALAGSASGDTCAAGATSPSPHALYPRPILSRTFTLKVPRTWSSHVRLVASLLTCPPQRSLPTLREPVSPSIPSLPSVLPGGCRRPLATPSGYACAAGATPPRPILTRSLQHGT